MSNSPLPPTEPFATQLRQAAALHQQGQWAQAEVRYEALLQQHPEHFELLQLAGVCALQQGRMEEARGLLARALASDAEQPVAWVNHGYALLAMGQAEAAQDSYQRALALDPQQPDALQNLGNLLLDAQHYEAALVYYARLLVVQPQHVPTLTHCGQALHALGRLPQALEAYRQALQAAPEASEIYFKRALLLRDLQQHQAALDDLQRLLAAAPQHVAALWHQGMALRALQRYDAALVSYAQALALEPAAAMQAALHASRGNVLRDLQQPQAALEAYQRALALLPDYADAWSNQGAAWADLGQYAQALECYERALALQAEHPEARLNRANAWRLLGQPAAALTAYDELLQARPENLDGWLNRGLALMDLARYRDAQDSYAQALALDPQHAEVQWNHALCRLLLGDFAKGWPAYEARWRSRRLGVPRRDFPQALWLGDSDLRGQRLLIHAEQGLGDTLQFCRYLPLLSHCGADLMVEVQPSMLRLLRSLPGHYRWLAQGEALPPFDRQCPLLSVPLACANLGVVMPAAVPAEIPYLSAEPQLAELWQQRLDALPQRAGLPRIGLAWRGSGSQRADPRGLPFARLAPWLAQPAQFISLQLELSGDEAAVAATNGLAQVGTLLGDFAETAALLANLDLVITIDTAVAHLAGALGKPVWVLLPFNADWRWMSARSDSLWYPSARLFRQNLAGDWSSVVEAVQVQLGEFVRR